LTGVKIRMWASPPRWGGRTKVTSERFISRAMRCIRWAVRSAASKKTATGLPASGSRLKASTTTYLCMGIS
jgi:hypothetical protein